MDLVMQHEKQDFERLGWRTDCEVSLKVVEKLNFL